MDAPFPTDAPSQTGCDRGSGRRKNKRASTVHANYLIDPRLQEVRKYRRTGRQLEEILEEIRLRQQGSKGDLLDFSFIWGFLIPRSLDGSPGQGLTICRQRRLWVDRDDPLR